MVATGMLIRQLREAHGMTQTQLGERLGLRKDQVSKIEHGVRRLDVAETVAVAEALGTTARRLMGRPESTTLALAARLTSRDADDPDRGPAGGRGDAVIGRARQLLELEHLLGELGVLLPARTSGPGDRIVADARALPDAVTSRQATVDGMDLAVRTRAALGLGSAPVGNLADLAERHFGVDVECGPFGPGISGMCVHAGPTALVLANTGSTAGHLRFTLAHELAHHLLGDPREVVVEDGLCDGEAVVERRANAFAAHLLMPVDEVVRVVAGRQVGDEVLAELMQHFQVSLASLVHHLVAAKIVDPRQRQALAERSARRLITHHGDPGQADPTRSGHGVRPPRRLLTSARTAYRDGRIGATIVAVLLGTSVEEIASDRADVYVAGDARRSSTQTGLVVDDTAADRAADVAAAFSDL